MGRSTEEVVLRLSVTIIVLFSLAGCGATRDALEDPSSRLREYEASFHPSDYNQPLKDFFPETHPTGRVDSSSTLVSGTSQQLELTQGYRVQIFATTSYDEAVAMKATVEAQFTEEWFYLVYDAPTYKLRAGNFLERYEADRFARLVAEKGYKDAWVVPERVFKNPPPRAASVQEIQK